MPATVAFCETSQHVSHLFDKTSLGQRIDAVVALTPEVAFELQKRALSYLKLEDYYSATELISKHGEVFAEEVKWADWIDEFIQSQIPEFGKARFRSASSFLFMLQMLLNEYYAGSYILERFFENAKPNRVLYQPWLPSEPPWHLQHRESIYSTLLPILAPRYGVELDVLESNIEKEPQSSGLIETKGSSAGNAAGGIYRMTNSARQFALSHRLGEEARLLHRFGVRRYLESLVKQGKTKHRVLMVGHGYDLDPLVLALRNKEVRIDWLPDALIGPGRERARNNLATNEVKDRLFDLWATVVDKEEFWAPLTEWGIGRNPRIESSLSFWWHRLIPEMWEGYRRAAAVLSHKSYSAVVTWEAGAGSLGASVFAAARAQRIPCVIYQHGGSGRISVPLNYHCLEQADCFLVYGAGTETHFRRNCSVNGHARAKVVPVGSARLDELRIKMTSQRVQKLRAKLGGSDSRPLILYVPTHFNGYGRALSDLGGYPDVSYFELQQRVVRLFAEYRNVRLLYKDFLVANGLPNPIPDYIRQCIPNGASINAPPLTELVWAVDAIILDHALTALGEALPTRKRLIVYDERRSANTLEPAEAKGLLSKRAIVAEEPDEFIEKVRSFLCAGDFSELTTPNDEFLCAYGTHLNDGRSAERAADFVLKFSG